MHNADNTNVSVSVVIPVFNNRDTLPPLLNALKSQSIVPDEVIVVDDCSTDDSVNIASRYEDVRVIQLKINSGPSVARNKGVEAATKDIIFFLDSDAVPSTNAVDVIKEAFVTRPNLVVMNGIMEKEPLNPNLFSKYKALIEYSWAQAVPCWDDTNKCLNARIGSIRRQEILSVGGFDPVYRKPSVEDHELGLRLVKHYPIYVNHKLTAFHHFPGFFKTCKNYYERTVEFLELMWSVQRGSATDKGGVSTKNAAEAILGALGTMSLFSLIWGIWWIPFASIIMFVISSMRSLRFHIRFGGVFFFLFSIGLHMVYSCVIVAAAVKTLICFKGFGWRYGPIPLSIRTLK